MIKSFCQELQGGETPCSKSENWNTKQYFVSLTHCIDISGYFNGGNDWRLYFKGVSETAAPILFKGRNPHTGEFGDKIYRKGYPE